MVKYKIAFVNKHIQKTQIQPIRRAVNEIEDRGFQWVDTGEDVTLFQGRLLNLQSLDAWIETIQIKSPIIVLDQSDGVMLRYIELLDHPQVIGFIKKQMLKDKSLYDFSYHDSRYHFWLYLQKQKYGDHPIPQPIEKKINWNKIKLGWNLGNANMIQKLLSIEIPIKDIDIHCSLRTSNNGSTIYEAHRKQCIRQT
jgi:hypothetical protein